MSEPRVYELDDFSPLVGDSFRLHHGEGESVEIELLEAVSRVIKQGVDPKAPVRQFSLLFLDPLASVQSYLPQSIYRLEHETFGTHEIFLVPVGPNDDGRGICFEAVFNSLG